jgi:hypothetical protein
MEMLTRVVLLELGQIVNVAVYGDVQAVGLVVRGNLGSCEYLGHGGNYRRDENDEARLFKKRLGCKEEKYGEKKRKETDDERQTRNGI